MSEIQVACDAEATPEALAGVDEAFRRAGFEVRSEASVYRKSADPLPWVIYVTIASPIVAFFQSFGAEAGKDAYAAVKQWVSDVREARDGSGAMVLRDSDYSNLVLGAEIPDEALDALRDLDWSEKRGGYLVWSHARREWLDPMKNSSAF